MTAIRVDCRLSARARRARPRASSAARSPDMTIYPGDPLTPGVGATDNAKRLTREDVADHSEDSRAADFLWRRRRCCWRRWTGAVAPDNWRGHLAITYRVGGGGPPVHLAVKSEWSLKTIYDVIATLKGAQYPDQWVIRGNHHDGWVFGASDPLAGQTAMLAEAKALGALVKAGWKPKRTIVYTSWDAEEPHAAGLDRMGRRPCRRAEEEGRALHQQRRQWPRHPQCRRQRGSGEIRQRHVGGHRPIRKPDSRWMRAAAPGCAWPARWRDEHDRAMGRAGRRCRPSNMPLEPLGSGSDYSAYPAASGAGDAGLSAMAAKAVPPASIIRATTPIEHHSKFVDPGFVYDALLAKTVGRAVHQGRRQRPADPAGRRFRRRHRRNMSAK